MMLEDMAVEWRFVSSFLKYAGRSSWPTAAESYEARKLLHFWLLLKRPLRIQMRPMWPPSEVIATLVSSGIEKELLHYGRSKVERFVW